MVRTRRVLSLMMSVAVSVSVCGVVHGQSNDQNAPGAPAPAPAKRGPGSKLPSQPVNPGRVSGNSLLTRTRPPMGLGGVRSKQPRGIGKINGTLLPKDPKPAIITEDGRRGGEDGRGRGGVVIGDRSRPIVRGGDRHDRDWHDRNWDDRNWDDRHGDGVMIDGRYTDDNFRLGFHLGAQSNPLVYPRHRLGYRRGNGYYSYNDYLSPYQYAYGVPQYVDASLMAPSTIPAQPPVYLPPEPETAIERGTLALSGGDGEQAVKELRRHLKDDPTDGPAMRLLALALLETGNVEESVAVMVMAYETEPSLAWEAIDGANAGWSNSDVRDRVESAVAYAHRTKTGSAWLSVALLMQAEGRDGLALKMLERASELGLSVRIAGELEKSLRP
ncbi:MAG: hypothetical protein H7Y88_11975 [Phycisphaerales bacterium]|nr:hypothetical protein [Phycisphaerales bacterium]